MQHLTIRWLGAGWSCPALAYAPWILRERCSGTRDIVDHLLLSRLPHFNLEIELGNSEAIKHAVRYGLGLSYLSRRVVAEALALGYTGGADDVAALPYAVCGASLAKAPPHALQRFIDFCQHHAGEDSRISVTIMPRLPQERLAELRLAMINGYNDEERRC